MSDRDFVVFHSYEIDRGKGYLNGLAGQVCQLYEIKSILTANLTTKISSDVQLYDGRNLSLAIIAQEGCRNAIFNTIRPI